MTIESLYDIFKQYPHVTTDSRRIIERQRNPDIFGTERCLFFALRGDNFDGNTFAEKALADGAAFAVIDDAAYQKSEKYLLVDDVLTTLQQLARHHRRQFDLPVIAITGSNGKTTTKELVAAAMNAKYNTLFTQGNLNNHIGVPLTLLQLTAEHETAIIEMGANHQGEIHALCTITEPTHGLITNIGKAHLEGFGGIEGVKKGKSEMYRWLAAHRGTIFLNEDEPFLAELVPAEARPIRYHRSKNPSPMTPSREDGTQAHYQARLESQDPFLTVSFLNEKGEILQATTHLVGEYNFNNVLTAIAVGKYFKVPAWKIRQAIVDYLPTMNRSQILTLDGGATLILDAYNANPSSMRQALLNLSTMPQPRKVAILGDMRELGDESAAEHLAILTLAKSLHFNQLVTVGSEFGRQNTEGVHFENTDAAKAWFKTQTFDDTTCLLIKGSRGMKLETLLT